MSSDRSKGTVCVTGGAGFIGSHVAEAFLAQGRRVLIIDNLSGGRRENVPPGAELHVLDIRSREAADLMRESGIEILVHHAAQMDVRRSVEDPVFDADVNIKGSLNLAEAARRGGVRQVLFASTGGAIYGEQDYFPADENHPARPVSPYGISKRSFELYLFYYSVTYGLDATCLRYANVYGERQNPHGEAGVVAIFLNRLLAGGGPTINGEGGAHNQRRGVADPRLRPCLGRGAGERRGGGPARVSRLQRGHRRRDLRGRPLQGDRPLPGIRPQGQARPGQARGAATLGGGRQPRPPGARAAAADPPERRAGTDRGVVPRAGGEAGDGLSCPAFPSLPHFWNVHRSRGRCAPPRQRILTNAPPRVRGFHSLALFLHRRPGRPPRTVSGGLFYFGEEIAV